MTILLGGFVPDALGLTADLLCARWKRAVGMLWRESISIRQESMAARERLRAGKRRKNLQRIVRRALADYHQIELQRQLLIERPQRRS